MELVFRPENHTYWMGDELIPNTTRVLSSLVSYDHIPSNVLERARQEGNAIHKMVELDCLNDLDEAQLPEWMHYRHDAWRRFKEDTGFDCIVPEQRVFHAGMRYAGTADLFGFMPKLKIKGAANIDVKRAFYAGSAIGLQLASYTDAWNASIHQKSLRIPKANRFALSLDADGKYRLQRFMDPNDFAVWTAQLICYKWRKQHGE